jgi:hypothetical protein
LHILEKKLQEQAQVPAGAGNARQISRTIETCDDNDLKAASHARQRNTANTSFSHSHRDGFTTTSTVIVYVHGATTQPALSCCRH